MKNPHTVDPQTMGNTVYNIVAGVTWHDGIKHQWVPVFITAKTSGVDLLKDTKLPEAQTC